jgi:hypothetical protein
MIKGLYVAALGATLVARPVVAQDDASIAGRIVSKASKAAVAGVDLELAPGSRRLVSDDSGRFKFDRVPAGNVTLLVRRIGFLPESLYVTLSAREDLDLLVELRQAPQVLDTVSVAAPAQPVVTGKLSEFYERKKFGIGRFIEAREFENVLHYQMADILASRLSGVRKVPLGGVAVAIGTRRGTPHGLVGSPRRGMPCLTAVYLDGTIVAGGAGMPPFDINQVDPQHVAAIEFYTGLGQIPAQFNKTGSGCGVLLIWTK